MMSNWGGFGGWGMGFGVIFMLVFWLLVILGIVALVRWLLAPRSPGPSGRDKTPAEIVQERYARGEINREEYEQKMRDLTGGAHQ